MLDTLPIEILEMVIRLLELQDIRNLRASSRILATMTSHGHFQTYFHVKSILLTKDSAPELKHMLCYSELARSLQDLVVVSPRTFQGNCRMSRVRPGLINLLTGVFKTLHSRVNGGQLRSLHLSMSPILLPPGKPRPGMAFSSEHFQSGALVYQAVMLALQASALRVERLDMFSSGSRCKIPIDQLVLLLPGATHLAPGLVHTRSLTLNLTQTLQRPPWQRTLRSFSRSIDVARHSIAALGTLLRQMPSLQHLDLRWYILNRKSHPTPGDAQGIRFFDLLSVDASFPPLQSCALRGLHLAQMPLLHFLRKTSATKILLEEIRLKEGTFAPILDHLFHKDSKLEDVCLDHLWEDQEERRGVLWFTTVTAVGPPHPEADHNPCKLVRTGEEVNKPYRSILCADTPPGPSYGWKERQRRYGPPRDAWG